MKKSCISFILICSILIGFTSCDENRLYEENITIPDNGWNIDNIIKFEVVVEDPSILTNFYINVRNADGYPYSNLFVFIKTTFPNNKTSIDTLECILADEKGKWLGSGIGDIFDNQIPFKKNVQFPTKGTYKFELQHGMRNHNIPQIMDIGLRVEKVK